MDVSFEILHDRMRNVNVKTNDFDQRNVAFYYVIFHGHLVQNFTMIFTTQKGIILQAAKALHPK